MTYEELKTKLTGLVTSPDTAAAELPGILEDVKIDYELAAGMISKVAAQEDRIKTLQEGNNRLLLMQLGEHDKPDNKEETDNNDTSFADVFSKKKEELEKGE